MADTSGNLPAVPLEAVLAAARGATINARQVHFQQLSDVDRSNELPGSVVG